MGREKAHRLDLLGGEAPKGNPIPAVEEDEMLNDLFRPPIAEAGAVHNPPPTSTPSPEAGQYNTAGQAGPYNDGGQAGGFGQRPQAYPDGQTASYPGVPPMQQSSEAQGYVPYEGTAGEEAVPSANASSWMPQKPPQNRTAGQTPFAREEGRNEGTGVPYGEGRRQAGGYAPSPERELFQDITEDGKRVSQLSGRAGQTMSGMPQSGNGVRQGMQTEVPYPQMGYQAPEPVNVHQGDPRILAEAGAGQLPPYPQAEAVYRGSFGNTVSAQAQDSMAGQVGAPVYGNAGVPFQGQVSGYPEDNRAMPSQYMPNQPMQNYAPYPQAPQRNQGGQQEAPYPQAGVYQQQGNAQPQNGYPSQPFGYRYPGMAKPESHFQDYRRSVITIYSPKGGIGKSSVAKEIAFCLSMKGKDKEHFKVLLVDADWQFGDVSTLFGKPSFPNSGGWVAQMRKDREAKGKIPMYHPQYITQNFIQHVNETLDILCRSDDPLDAQSVDAGIVRAMVQNLKQCDYDYILFDASNSIRDTTSAHLVLSDLIFYITTLDATTLNETQSTFKTLRQMQFDMSKLKVILNKMPRDEKNLDISPQEIESWFRIKILAAIPDVSDKLRNANNDGRCFTMDNPKSDYAKEMQKVVNMITPTFKEKKSLFDGLFSGRKGR